MTPLNQESLQTPRLTNQDLSPAAHEYYKALAQPPLPQFQSIPIQANNVSFNIGVTNVNNNDNYNHNY